MPKGPPVFFLHGFPSSSWDWAKVEPLLAKRFRLGYLDFLGFGASSKPSRHRYSLMEQARIARAALAALGFDRFHLVAHDYGASVAQQFLCEPALRSRIASLTIINGGVYSTLHEPALAHVMLRSAPLPAVSRFVTRERFGAGFRRLFGRNHQPSATEIDGQWAALASGGGTLRASRFARYIEDRLEFGPMWESALEQSEVPLNFIWGMLDPVAGKGAIEYALLRQRSFPNVTTLPDVGHYPHLEAPERTAASIAAFVEATPAGVASPVLTLR